MGVLKRSGRLMADTHASRPAGGAGPFKAVILPEFSIPKRFEGIYRRSKDSADFRGYFFSIAYPSAPSHTFRPRVLRLDNNSLVGLASMTVPDFLSLVGIIIGV